MRLWSLFQQFPGHLRQFFEHRQKRRPETLRRFRFRNSVEDLESRLVLFAATGNAWPTASVITISFEPDGTNLGGVTSNLNQAFNGNSDLSGRWQTEILRAAQVWAQATNINFVVVADNGAASGSGKYQQGDPGFGDIRIGGYNFGNSSLAGAYMPPPDNNYSIAGDIVFNTGANYGIGRNYDLFTVAVHEFGHALGLDHTSAGSPAEMWATYTGIKPKLSADDVAGIRSIYSGNAARSADSYDISTSNDTIAAASDVTGEISKTKSSAVVDGLDLTTATDVDYFKFTAPKWVNDSMIVGVQSDGLSLLTPKLTILSADQKTVLGTASGANKYGTTVSSTLNNLVAGQTYYIKVEAADASVFGVGTYGLILDFGAKTSPTATIPKTSKANGKTPSSSGGVAEGKGSFDQFLAPTPVIQAITPDTGASSTDRTTNSRQITLQGVGSITSNIEVFQNGVSIGKTLNLLGVWSFNVPGNLADGTYSFTAHANAIVGVDLLGLVVLGQDLGTSDALSVKIDTTAPNAPSLSATGSATLPTGFAGTSEPSSTITILDNGTVVGSTTADGQGNWRYDLGGNIASGKHTFTATATDLAGNTSVHSASQNVTVNGASANSASPSNISYITKSSSVPLLSTLNIFGTANANNTVQLYLGGTALGTVTADSNGNWTYQYGPLLSVSGIYQFSSAVVEPAGSALVKSSVYTLVASNTAAAVANLALASSSSNTLTGVLSATAAPTITGTASRNSVINVFDGNRLLGTVTADATGKWLYTSPTLSKGRHSLVAVSSDSSGIGMASSPLTFFV